MGQQKTRVDAAQFDRQNIGTKPAAERGVLAR
jgi:hypothetical protein